MSIYEECRAEAVADPAYNTKAVRNPAIPAIKLEDLDKDAHGNVILASGGRINSVPELNSNTMVSVDVITPNGIRRAFGWKEILRNLFTKGNRVQVVFEIAEATTNLPRRPQICFLSKPDTDSKVMQAFDKASPTAA